MTEPQALQHLSTLPLGHSSLQGMERLLALLDNPQNSLTFLLVGGDLGKEAVAFLLYSTVNRCEYRGGYFALGECLRLQQQIQVEGEGIDSYHFGMMAERVFSAGEEVVFQGYPQPTQEEVLFAVALLYFNRVKTDMVVVQATGLGSHGVTNLLKPLITVLCPMKSVHDLPAIQQGTPVVVAPQSKAVEDHIETLCGEQNVPYLYADPLSVRVLSENPEGQRVSVDKQIYQLKLVGQHQRENLAVVLEVFSLLSNSGFPYDQKDLQAGLARAVCWGQLEAVHHMPRVYVDFCHEIISVTQVVNAMDALYGEKSTIYLLGMTQIHPDVLSLLETRGKEVILVEDKVIQQTVERVTAEDVICAIGSRQIVAQVRHIFGLS